MGPWADFYRGRLGEGYRQYFAERYKPFLDRIRDCRKEGDRIVEIGCGIGTTTSILAADGTFCGYRCFDICPEMVVLARINTSDRPCDIGDARHPTGRLPDIVHSHGLLEHMSDDDIRSVIESSRLDGARWAIHYVPGDKYKTPSFGDERLMPLERWREICKPTETFRFNDDHDYCLIWRF